jgi:signal transduction histidine kinase
VSRRNALLGLLALMPVAADIIATVAFPARAWSQLLPGLYYACIVIAGLEYGWRAGLVLALVAGISRWIILGMFLSTPFVHLEAQLVAFLIVAFAFLENRRRRLRTNSAPAAPPGYGQLVRVSQCMEQVTEISSELLRDLRTPFASIEGAAFILSDTSTSARSRDEFVEIILQECKRVEGLLADLGNSTEVVPLSCRFTDAASLLSEVVRLAALQRPDPGVSLRIEVAPNLPPLWCDPVRIQQTILPFLTSAMEAMGGGGELLLAADRQDGQVRIQLKVLGQTVRAGDPAGGRGAFSSTFDSPRGACVLAARRTVLQHGGTIAVDQSGPLKKLLFLSLPLYDGRQP